MRKITTEAINAFLSDSDYSKDNTTVYANKYQQSHMILSLHGNAIAEKEIWKDKPIRITNAWWFSTTTKERLNGIPGVRINQKAWQWYLNGKAWDGSWIAI